MTFSHSGSLLRADEMQKTKVSRGFAKSISPENSLAKPSPHCSATRPETSRAEHQRKMSFPLSRKISPPPNQESKRHFSLGLPREARQWRNDTSVRGSFKSPRAPRVRLVGIRVAFKIHSNFVQQTPQTIFAIENRLTDDVSETETLDAKIK